MTMIRITAVAIGLAAMWAAGLTAQTQETKTTTSNKVEITGGKDMTVIGCLNRNPGGDYILTKAAANSVKPLQYALISSDDLAKHVGERVEIHGKAVTAGNGRVTVESKTKTQVENGKDRETQGKTEGAIALVMPWLGVTSMKTLSPACK